MKHLYYPFSSSTISTTIASSSSPTCSPLFNRKISPSKSEDAGNRKISPSKSDDAGNERSVNRDRVVDENEEWNRRKRES